MDLELSAFLIVCPLVFLGGFVDSIAGGGGLITLPAYLIAGLPPHYAIATNKLSSLVGTSVAAFRMWRHKFIDIGFMLPAVIAALIGAAIGARLVLMIDERYLQYLLLIILPLTAFYVLRKKDYDAPARDIPRKKLVLRPLLSPFFWAPMTVSTGRGRHVHDPSLYGILRHGYPHSLRQCQAYQP